jgi:hypothetical protein
MYRVIARSAHKTTPMSACQSALKTSARPRWPFFVCCSRRASEDMREQEDQQQDATGNTE